jgi:polyisoprenyl-phosphate glycosyltransferase
MFLFSVQFLFLSEYLVQILSSSPPSNRRHLVARELRGTLSGRSSRLNLVDGEGRFHVGAPQRLLSPDTK